MRKGRGASLFLSSSLLFTVCSWRLGELFQVTTLICLCSATDNCITQLRLRWVKSPPVTSGFSSSSIQIRLCPHLLLVSSVISMGHGAERFMCFEELPVEVNVFGGMIRKVYADLMWVCRNERGTSYELLKRWGWLLFDLHTNSLKSQEKITSFLYCVWHNQ